MPKAKTPLQFLRLPPVKWQKAVDQMTEQERFILASAMDRAAVTAARACAYLGMRSNGGDGGHAQAVKAQNQTAAKVRRALGYVYPKDNLTF